MRTMILVVGSASQDHPAHVFQKIREKGGQPVFFEPWRFPAEVMVSFNAGDPIEGSIRPNASGPPIPLSEIQSVYCRYILEFVNLKSIPEPNPQLQETLYHEIRSALGSLFRNMDCLWVDSVDSFDQHLYKGHQYKLLKAAGIRVPEMMISNDPEQIVRFYEQHGGEIVSKPCWFGAYTHKMTAEDLKPDRLKALSRAPVNFQEYIPGMDILVYLVKDELFAAEVWAQTVDFRSSEKVAYRPVVLPDAVARDCLALARILDLKFSVIDLRRTPDGEYVFFEGNPSPIFLHFEQATGYPLTSRLVDLLMLKPSAC